MYLILKFLAPSPTIPSHTTPSPILPPTQSPTTALPSTHPLTPLENGNIRYAVKRWSKGDVTITKLYGLIN